MVNGAEVTVRFTWSAERRIGIGNTNTGAWIAEFAGFAWRGRRLAGHTTYKLATAHTIALVDGASVVVQVARGTRRCIREECASPGERIAFGAAIANSRRRRTKDVAHEEAIALAVAFFYGAKVAVFFTTGA